MKLEFSNSWTAIVAPCFALITAFSLVAHSSEEASTIQAVLSQNDQIRLEKFVWETQPLKALYELNQFEPLWIKNNGSTKVATDGLQKLKNFFQKSPQSYGLRSSDYWTSTHDRLFQAIDSNNWISLEIAASESLLLYADHLEGGRISPAEFPSDVTYKPKSFTRFAELLKVAQNGQDNYENSLSVFSPTHPIYKNLLASYQQLLNAFETKSWESISSPGVDLEKGNSNSVIAKIKKRFKILKYSVSNFTDLYDDEFDKNLLSFQKNSGIPVGSGIGKNSNVYRVLGIGLPQRLAQLEVNLERARWMPDELGERYAFVNTAATEVHIVDMNKVIMAFKTINGHPEHQTPSMSDKISTVILNPQWHVPYSVASKEILRILQDGDLDYLVRNNMHVYDGETEVDPTQIIWMQYSQDNLPFSFVQDSGDGNALGVLKFQLSNPFNIYMHDTNQRYLFANSERHRSHGCVRLEKPFELAQYVLNDPKWTAATIKAVTEDLPISKRETAKAIRLSNPLKVFIMYMTASPSSDGLLRFSDDAYNQDGNVKAVIKKRRAEYGGSAE